MDGTRTLVGAFRPGARPRHPLFSEATSAVIDSDPIVVAASGGRVDPAETICLLDGFLFERERLAAGLGMPAARSDEQLVGAAYSRWGVEMLDRLQGEFALLVWRSDLKRGLIARDRSGTRPMFTCAQGAALYFASEVRELLALLPKRPGPDEIGVARSLGGWTLPDDRTLYEGLRRLGAGSLIELDAEGFNVRRYWRPRPRPPLSLRREEAVEEIRRLIGAAVTRRVRPEDEVGIQLSGGLDSSAVAAIGSRVLDTRGKRLFAYSAEFPDTPGADESEDLDVLAAGLEVPQFRMQVTGGSPLAAAIDYLQRWEVPLGPPNHFIWQPFLRLAAERGVTVMLDGDGGDEVFAASPYLLADRLRRLRLVEAVRLARTLPGARAGGLRFAASSLRSCGLGGLLPTAVAERRSVSTSFLTAEAVRLFRAGNEAEPWRRWRGPRWWASRASQVFDQVESLGVYDYTRRRATMAGLASRHPLLDPELIEFMLRLPPEWSFDPVFDRPLLREAGIGLIPDQIRLKRRKAVFSRVFRTPLVRMDLPAIRDVLGNPRAEVSRYVRRDVVSRDILPGPTAHPGGEVAWMMDAWRLINVECWLRMQNDPRSLDPLVERIRGRNDVSRTFFLLDDAGGSA